MKVVLTSIGSRGDVQPMLAIAQALAARGHRPLVAAPPDFAPWVRRLGFEFAPLGIDVGAFMQQHRETLGGNIAKFFSAARRMFERDLPAQLDAFLSLARDAGAIVFAGGSVMAPSAGEKLGIPVLGVLFTPAVLPSPAYAPVMIPWRTLPRWINRLLWRASDPMWNLLLRKGLNAGRERHALATVRDVSTHLFAESRFVLAVDDAVLPPDAVWAPRVEPVGFLFLEPAEQSLDAGLEAWLRDGDPPIYVGFGSMTGRGPERMRTRIVEAIAATGRRGLVGAGWARLGDGSLPSHWRVVGDVPHGLLFPRVACVVHHGGSGTMAAALRAGVPQVVVPLILDQYHHAQRLYEIGLAPRPVPMESITAAQLGSAIAESMTLATQRRARIAVRVRASRAADRIVDRLEGMARDIGHSREHLSR